VLLRIVVPLDLSSGLISHLSKKACQDSAFCRALLATSALRNFFLPFFLPVVVKPRTYQVHGHCLVTSALIEVVNTLTLGNLVLAISHNSCSVAA
jgi:hypothetical protein